MAIFIYSDDYELDWPGHVFPTNKYKLLREKLLRQKIITEKEIITPVPAKEDELLLVHTKNYLARLNLITKTPELGILEFEVPVSRKVLDAVFLSTGGTILACKKAVEEKTAVMNIGGGFHHAFADHGEGFCIINDVAVGICVALKEGFIKRSAVIDCDLHQGNGTAHIFRNNPNVFTFSIHQENNYPVKQKSSIDVGLDDFTGDDVYNSYLRKYVPEIIENFKPELIMYVAGADPYEKDLLGALKLTKEGLKIRDKIVFENSFKYNIPVVVLLAGGYSENVDDVVDIHYNTALTMKEFFCRNYHKNTKTQNFTKKEFFN